LTSARWTTSARFRRRRAEALFGDIVGRSRPSVASSDDAIAPQVIDPSMAIHRAVTASVAKSRRS
jgi:hypothetical protein